MSSPRLLLRALLAAACALAALPAAASADSIVFVKEANVWLAHADGSGAYQVTTDGTAEQPYRVPVQSDDGTIVASHHDEIVRMRQNGEVINTIDPEPLVNSVGHPVDGPPVNLAVSPDGSRIAYSLVGYECPVGADCMTRSVTAFTAADRLTPAAQYGVLHRRNPSFVSATRALVFGGYAGQVNVTDLGDDVETHWFDDYDVFGQADATDLGDGELSRQGDRLALIRSYGEDTHVIWYAVDGSAATAKPPAVPEPLCKTGTEEGLAGPTWSPDGGKLAFAGQDGIYVTAIAADCAASAPALAIPGASQPDWGPAEIAPGPRKGTGPGGGGPGSGPGGQPGAPAVAVKALKAKKVARRGLPVRVTCAAACSVKATLKVRKLRGVVATAKGSAPAGGTVKLTLKPKRALRKKLARLRGAKATVKVVVDGGAPVIRKITLR
jgi:opacity protein-like surface antigen